jgi:hypothetical protein
VACGGVGWCKEVSPFLNKKGLLGQEKSRARKGDRPVISQEQRLDLQRVVGLWCREHCLVQTVAEAEQVAEQVSQAAGAAVVEALVPTVAGRASYEGVSRACECGGRARFMNYRRRGIGTLYGVVPVSRAYYHCSRCHRGQLPWDQAQGLDGRLWTPRVKSLLTQLAVHLSFQETVDLLAETLGFVMEDSSADEVVREVGQRLRGQERALMREYEGGDLALQVAGAPPRLYISMDGTSAHIDGGWHEVKAGVVYQGRRGDGGVDEACELTYVAAQESSEDFGSRLYLLAAQAGVEQAQERVVIGDGAEWIWQVARHHYPGARQIVDYWHACEHVHDLARSYYGEGSKAGQRWAREHCRALKEKGPVKLLRALSRMRPRTPEQAEAVRRERGYFRRNRHRMQYRQFRGAGLMIGSGPVEAACKVVVGQRLKRAGMRWSAAGADSVLAARAALLSGKRHAIDEAARAA